MIEFAPRMSRFGASASTLASALARKLKAEGRDIISLTAGEPDFPTPENVKQAAIRAMEREETKYTNVDGTPALKEAVSAKFKRDNGLDYAPEESIAGTGAKQIIFNALMATVGAGDEVIVPVPYWVSYEQMPKLAGGTPVPVPCPQNNGYRLLAEDLAAAITPKTKWLILNSPNNPTGATYSRQEMQAITDVLVAHPQVWLMTDDIYEFLIYDGREFCTPAQVEPRLYERTLTVNGVSKAYSMTGWRLGFAGGPAALIKAMTTIQSQSTSGPSSISQAAAVEALSGPQDFLAERQALMQARRDAIFEELSQVPEFACHRPEGAMYLFVNCAGMLGRKTPSGTVLETDQDVTAYFLEAAGVATVHGGAYGVSPYFRASFALYTEVLREAGRRLHEACAKLD